MKFKEFKNINNFIYIFKHPLTNEVKYVGQSSTGAKRLYSHFHKSTLKKYNQRVYNWIRKLKKENLEPKIELVEELNNKKDLDCAEIFWIQYFKLQDNNLCNHTDGGKSTINGDFYNTKEWIKKQVDSHLKQSKKTIEVHTQRIFNSTAEAARFFNIKRTDVSKCVTKKCYHHEGFIFQYYNSEVVPKIHENNLEIELKRKKTIQYFDLLKKQKQRNSRKDRVSIKEVITGKIFKSLKEAGDFFNIDHSTVRRIAKKECISKAGYIFEFL